MQDFELQFREIEKLSDCGFVYKQKWLRPTLDHSNFIFFQCSPLIAAEKFSQNELFSPVKAFLELISSEMKFSSESSILVLRGGW